MNENIYDHLMSTMSQVDGEEDKKAFFETFWATMSREERVVFTIDALKSFEKEGTLKTFVQDVNEDIVKKQDDLMDLFIAKEMPKEEFIEKIKKVRKFETESHTKK